MKAIVKPRIDLEGRTRLETVIPLSTPYLVFLDPSDICNASCAFCPTGSGEALKYKKPQLMDFDLYQKIIDDLCAMPEPIKTLRLYSDGESLLNPMLPKMVRDAKETGRFGQIDTTTNGSLLRPILNVQLIAAGLDKIFVSVPQIYTPAYVRNVKNFYDNSQGRCQVYVKTIGDTLTEHEKTKFMADFGDISDRIFIENLINCWPDFGKKVDSETGIYGNPLTDVKVCPYPFYSLKINSDGTVSVCFLDWPHKMILGSLADQSFKSIWNGEKLKSFRLSHLYGKRGELEFCHDCGQLTHGAPDVLDEYAEELLKRIR